MVDLMRLRKHIVENVPDAVVYPKNREDISALVKYCCEQKIPMYVYGGGTSVTRGVEAVKGGITLDMRKNFNKVLSFSEHNQTITVEAGMSGPSLKRPSTTPSRPSAQSAPIPAATSRRASSIPPSAAGLSPAAQVRTRAYYGKIEDIVISQEYVTPIGIIKSDEFPRNATGPFHRPDHDGQRGNLRHSYSCHPQSFQVYAENRKEVLLCFQAIGRTVSTRRAR